MEAIVLAGGRSRRMGSDKLVLERDGRSVLQRACDALAPHVDRIIVAGPARDGCEGVTFVVEDPPFGGPVAGIAAALTQLDDGGLAFLLAGDLAEPEAVVDLLRRHQGRLVQADAVVLEDEDGWPQYLAGLYHVAALRRAVARWDSLRDLSVRRLMSSVNHIAVRASGTAVADLDTPEQARRHGYHGAESTTHGS